MLIFNELNHRVSIEKWVENEGLALIERDDCIDWDIVNEDDINGMLVDFLTCSDCGDNLHNALFIEADSAEISLALLNFAFKGRVSDLNLAQIALHDAIFGALKAYVEDLAEIKQSCGWG